MAGQPLLIFDTLEFCRELIHAQAPKTAQANVRFASVKINFRLQQQNHQRSTHNGTTQPEINAMTFKPQIQSATYRTATLNLH